MPMSLAGYSVHPRCGLPAKCFSSAPGHRFPQY
jgi:hypothetical protein